MGKKDIIKIDGGLDVVDLDVLGYIDHSITVNIIKDSKIAEKKSLRLPQKITNVIFCQKSALHHIDRAGASSCILPGR